MRTAKNLISSAVLIFLASSLQAQEWQYSNSNAHYNGGNVGIGTTTPASKLHIIGNIEVENATTTAPTMQLRNTGFSNFGSLISYPGAGTNTGSSFSAVPRGTGYSSGIRSQIGVLNTDMIADPVNYEFLVARATGDQFCVASGKSGTGTIRPLLLSAGYGDGTTNSNQLFLHPNGNVGMGISSPWAKLDIRTAGSGASDHNALNINNPSNEAFGTVSMIMGTANESAAMISEQRNGLGKGASLLFYTTDNAGAYQNRLFISDAGNIGIGTLDPLGYKLAVKGSVLCTKVKVISINNWPDYVFHASYRLCPLSEVEQYIQQYHHLPEVPSAEEVAKDGLDLGDNQATLLKKIEELTLYLIDQNKKLEAQIKKNEEQNKQLDEQQQQINELKKLAGRNNR